MKYRKFWQTLALLSSVILVIVTIAILASNTSVSTFTITSQRDDGRGQGLDSEGYSASFAGKIPGEKVTDILIFNPFTPAEDDYIFWLYF